jgi:hypothetical protein
VILPESLPRLWPENAVDIAVIEPLLLELLLNLADFVVPGLDWTCSTTSRIVGSGVTLRMTCCCDHWSKGYPLRSGMHPVADQLGYAV